MTEDPDDAPIDRSGKGGRALLTNAGMMLASRYVIAALGWAGTVIIVRNLSVDEYGKFAFVFSFVLFVAVFADLEVGRVAIKGLLDPNMDPVRFAGTLVVMRAVMGLITYVFALLFILVANYPPEVLRATMVAGIAMVIGTPSHAIESIYQAHLRMGTVAVGNVFGQVTQVALTAAVAVAGGSVIRFAVPFVVGEIVIIVWRLVRVGRIQDLRPNIDLSTWWRLLREALPLAAGTVLVTAYYRLDSVMLSKLDTFTSVGIYNVAYKFVDVVHYVSSALKIPLLTILVGLWPHQPAAFRQMCQRAYTILLVLGALIVTEMLLFARPVISLLYGPEYAVGADAARLVVGAECIGIFGGVAVTVLIAMGRNRFYPVVALVGLATNVALNLILIPVASYEGAAIATLITEIAVVTVLMVVVSRQANLRAVSGRQVLLAVMGGALAALVGAAVWQVTVWPVAALAVAATYIIFAHVTRLPGEAGWRSLLLETSPAVR